MMVGEKLLVVDAVVVRSIVYEVVHNVNYSLMFLCSHDRVRILSFMFWKQYST